MYTRGRKLSVTSSDLLIHISAVNPYSSAQKGNVEHKNCQFNGTPLKEDSAASGFSP